MYEEILKKLIYESYINAPEAIWLYKTYDKQLSFLENESDIKLIAEKLLSFLQTKNKEIIDKSIEDRFFLFSTIRHIEMYIKLDMVRFDDMVMGSEEENDNGIESSLSFNEHSKEELDKLRIREEQLLEMGKEKLLTELLSLIDTSYSLVYNGFNKQEYYRARSHFWKNIGLENFGYYSLSVSAKKLMDDIHNECEQIIQQLVAKRELEITACKRKPLVC
jgi:hypothetical protein